MQPPVLNVKKTAVFLDFDGTLVDFAATPEAVVVSPNLRFLLQRLNERLEGAVALITGRSIESLDALLDWNDLCVAGCHGAEWRSRHTTGTVGEDQAALLESVRANLAAFAADNQLLLEHKPYSLALHFRNAPQLETRVDNWLNEKLKGLEGLRVIGGKSIREVQLQGMHKGSAIERFMQHPPFKGRMPVYVGDDVTDEDAFAWVNQVDGISVKVGAGETLANFRLSDYQAVSEWLGQMLEKGDEA